LGVLFYSCLLALFTRAYGNERFLLWSMLVILLIAEAKEPLLFSGNASRMFVLVLVFSQLHGLRHRTRMLVA
jgi:hypothetical protein